MNCLTFRFRRLIGAKRIEASDYRRHRSACPACAGFDRRIRDLDRRLHQAAMIPPPPRLAACIVARRALADGSAPRRWRMPVMAAALSALALALVLGLLMAPPLPDGLPSPMSGLGRDLLVYMQSSEAFDEAGEGIGAATADLAALLTRRGIGLKVPELLPVAQGRPCRVGNRPGVSLSMEGRAGAVEIILLPGEKAKKRRRVATDGVEAWLIPCPFGVLAILTRPGEDIDALEARIRLAIGWA